MSKNLLFLRGGGKLLYLATGMLVFTSCADVYDGNETWTSDVKNETLASPSANDITIAASTDGTKTTITWPVVYGASGYEVTVLNVNDEANPEVVDSYEAKFVDGCEVTISRAEDTNYKFQIKTLGNKNNNNSDAETATEVAFSSFSPTYMTIPDGSDLAEWFEANPIPDELEDGSEICYDLVASGSYTLSKTVDFGSHGITLRSASKVNMAKVTFAEETSISTSAGLVLKYVDFDCSASLKPFLQLSTSPDESIKGATGSGDYYNIMNPVTINSCNIEGVNYNLVFDGNKKYCVGTMLIKNCNIHLTSSASTDIKGNAVIYFKQGYVNDLTVQESTFWNNGDSDAKYFVQYNNSGRCDRGGYTSNSINYLNNTFYNIAKSGQWGNYGGFAGKGTSNWVMTNNIFVDCGNNQICRRFLGGRQNQKTATFSNNTYMFNGAFESTDGNVSGYDNSGTAIEEDPGFADAANGDFTVSGATQLSKRTGDPRWLPATEEE